MSAVVFDGEKLASEREAELTRKVSALNKKGIAPKLVSVVVGDDSASHLYVNLKGEAAKRVGIQFQKFEWKMDSGKPVSPSNSAGKPAGRWKINKLVEKVRGFNKDESVTGVMVQLPLTKGFRDKTFELLSAIDPSKDIDCLTSENLGRLMSGNPRFLPATVKAVVDILTVALGRPGLVKGQALLEGKRVAVVGRSNIVGKPLAAYLVNQHAVVTVAHSKTSDLKRVTTEADIVVSATGKPGLIAGDMVKRGAVVIDVGEPRGDVDFKEVKQVASFITPVPGGVGPMTVVSLLENVVKQSRNSL